MNLKELQKNWDSFGKTDPLWAILTSPEKRYNRWKYKEFFETGIADVNGLMAYLDRFPMKRNNNRALDFGCGVGRLSQALCRHYKQVCGIDIAPSMIDLANRHNRFKDRCTYILNTTNRLGMLESDSFDLVYSVITLQHIKPAFTAAYIKEFLRILRPTGIFVFQLPTGLWSKLFDQIPMDIPRKGLSVDIRAVKIPAAMTAGNTYNIIRLAVSNKSGVPLPGHTSVKYLPINLGNHWLDAKGNVVAWDDGRTAIMDNLMPGEKVELNLVVRAPEKPGDYLLEIDLVQERVCWFKQKGNKTLVIPVAIRSRSGKTKSVESSVAHPEMEMHCMPVLKVLSIVEKSGGIILETLLDQSAGPEWVSHKYVGIKL